MVQYIFTWLRIFDVPTIFFLNLECPKRCGLAFCDACCNKTRWHSTKECELLKNAIKLRNQTGSTVSIIGNISNWLLVVRCLMLRDTSPERWEMVQVLEDNLEEDSFKRQHLDNYRENVLNPLKKLFPSLTSTFEDNDILKICAKLDSNSFRQGERSRALFAVASMINHSCIPNARIFFDVAGNIKVLSKSYLEIGEEINITYCSQLLGTWVGKDFFKK